MPGTLCPWTQDCVPDSPGAATIAIVSVVVFLALGLNNLIGGKHKDKEK